MDYIKKIDENMEEQVEFLQSLLKINSENGEKIEKDGQVYPFGQGVQDAYELTMNAAKEMGFETENFQNYGGHIDFGEGEEILGIIGHIDVVPAGDGWEFQPYSGEIKDGYIYGRGTTDDKGPVVASLFAMKALKDAGYVPSKKVRLIIGLDEETNWFGLDHYLENVKEKPNFGFSPDGEFPVINGEKGIINFQLVKKLAGKTSKGLQLSKLDGGSVVNMVPESARALVYREDGKYDDIRESAKKYAEDKGYKLQVKGVGKSLEILAEGKAAHGASPEAGLNAISILFDFIGSLEFADEKLNDFLHFYNEYIGFNINGENIGCGFADEPSGKLTFNVGLASTDKESIKIGVNARMPLDKTDEDVYGGMAPFLDKYQIGVVKEKYNPPIFMDADTPMVKTMMEVYKNQTGDTEAKPMVIGGGTYSRAFDNMLAYGAMFPGEPDLMHQRNEKMNLESFDKMTKIYAETIYRLTQPDFHL